MVVFGQSAEGAVYGATCRGAGIVIAGFWFPGGTWRRGRRRYAEAGRTIAGLSRSRGFSVVAPTRYTSRSFHTNRDRGPAPQASPPPSDEGGGSTGRSPGETEGELPSSLVSGRSLCGKIKAALRDSLKQSMFCRQELPLSPLRGQLPSKGSQGRSDGCVPMCERLV